MWYILDMGRKKPIGDPRKVVAYVRVSTEEQNLGPDAQVNAIEQWVKNHGAELVAVHRDLGTSGGAPIDKRPGLVAALTDLVELGAGVLLVAKRDRIARDTVMAGTIDRAVRRAGARLLTADGAGNGVGPEGELVRGMLDVVAQFERGVIRQRTKAALAVKRSRGERVGGVPYGFRLAEDNIHLEPEPAEQQVLAQVHSFRRRGISVRGIAERLNKKRVPARGQKWHPTTIARLLSRAA